MATSPSLTPPVVDAMELWEVATVLGRARGVEVATGASLAAERRRAAREGRPQPTFTGPQRLPAGIGSIIPSNMTPPG